MKIKNTISFVLCIIMVGAMTACQPTPEEAIVQSKDKNLVEEVVEANKEENKQELEEDKKEIEQQIEAISQHLSMEYQANDRVKIMVDADVEIPTYDKIPMVRVEPYNFTKEHLKILLDEVCGENPVYYINTDGYSHWSKEEIEEILPDLKTYLQNNNLDSDSKEEIERLVDFVQEEYYVAKNKVDEKLFDGTLREIENNKRLSTATSLKSYLGKNQAARIEMSQSFNKTSSNLSFNNQQYGLRYTDYDIYEGVDADKINMSYEECRQMAVDLMHTLDGEDSKLSIISTRIGYSLDTFAGYTKKTSPQCYTFVFAKVYSGVYAYPKSCLRKNDNVNYSQVIETERIYVGVDDSGICHFYWSNPVEHKEVVTEDVPLIGFDKVNNVFKDYCEYKFSWIPTYDNISEDKTVTININSIEFNLMMTIEKDDIGSYIMIPVWDFIGDVTYDQEVFTIEGKPYEGEKDIAILTINAIDGTVIDREQGY